MTPAVVEERYGVPPALYPDVAALVRRAQRQPARRPRGRQQDRRQVAHPVRRPRRRHRQRGRDRRQGRPEPARPPRGRDPQPAAQPAGRRPRAPADGRRPARRASGTASRSTRCSTALEFRVLRDRLFGTLSAPEPEAEGGFDLDVEHLLGARRVAGWLAAHATGDAPACTSSGTGAAGRATPRAWRWPRADGAAGFVDLADADPEAMTALAAWLADADRPKVLHDAKGPLTALGDRGLPLAGVVSDTALAAYLVRPDQRSLRPGRPHAAPPRPRAAGRGEAAEDGQLALDVRRRPGRRRGRDGAGPRRARAGRGLDRELEERGAQALLPRSSCRSSASWPAWSSAGIAVDTDQLDRAGGALRAPRCRGRRRRATREIGQEINLGSPKQLQTVLFERARHAEDQAHQDRLHDRRRRAGRPLHARPSTRSCCTCCAHRDASRLRQTVEGLIKSVARRRPHPHHLPADDRRDRPAVAAPTRTCRTSRSAPRRAAGSARRSSSATGYESLLTADYSQIEMRIMAHLSGDDGLIEAFRSGEDLHRFVGSRVFGVAAGGGHAGHARRRSRRCRTAWPTGCRRSACPGSCRSRRTRRGADGRVLRPVRRRARLPAGHRRRRPGGPGTPRRSSAAAATCPTSPATTGSAARWPSGWR